MKARSGVIVRLQCTGSSDSGFEERLPTGTMLMSEREPLAAQF